jgi:hypothetical protein
MMVIDTISGFFTELQDDLTGELKVIDECLLRADTKKEEYKTLGNLLETHKNVQAMPFLQPSSTLTIKDLGNVAAVVDWYLKVTDKHFQQLAKQNTIPDDISNLGSARQRLSDWVGKVNTGMSAEETSLSLHPVSAAKTPTIPPKLLVSPSSLVCNIFTGETTSSQPITISNDGGGVLDWSAQLGNSTPPGFITLSASSGTNLGGGSSTPITVDFDATGVHGSTTPYRTQVNISATNPNNENNVVGTATVSITVIVADNLFLCVMNQLYQGFPTVVKRTEELFKRRDLTLSDRELDKITKSWDPVVKFVASPSAPCSCLNKPLADLITLHSQLEQLYDRIESNVTRSDEDLIGLE